VGPMAGLDGRKISFPPGFDPGSSNPYSVANRLSYPAHTTTATTTTTTTTNYYYYYYYYYNTHKSQLHFRKNYDC